jgi:hypothetical protein
MVSFWLMVRLVEQLEGISLGCCGWKTFKQITVEQHLMTNNKHI